MNIQEVQNTHSSSTFCDASLKTLYITHLYFNCLTLLFFITFISMNLIVFDFVIVNIVIALMTQSSLSSVILYYFTYIQIASCILILTLQQFLLSSVCSLRMGVTDLQLMNTDRSVHHQNSLGQCRSLFAVCCRLYFPLLYS